MADQGRHAFAYLYRRFVAEPDADTLLSALRVKTIDLDVLRFDRNEVPPLSSDWRSGVEPRVALYSDDIRLTADEIEIVLVARHEHSFLFLSMSYDPGWRAFVDGREVSSFPAFHIFTAVPIEESGSHTVKLLYQPVFRRLGAPIRVVGVAWIVLGIAFARLDMRSADPTARS